MKHYYKTIPMALLTMAAMALPSRAQIPQTDAVLVLHFQLTAVSTGPTTTNRNRISSDVHVERVTSRDVIEVLGAATGNSFSQKARLVLLTPTNDLDNWTVQVRDGNNRVDVSGFITHQPGTDAAGSAFVDLKNGNGGGSDYGIDGFTLHDQAGFPPLARHFSVSGFTRTSTKGTVNRRGQVVGQTDNIAAHVSGGGDDNGVLEVIDGYITADGNTTETFTPPPPNGGGVS